MAFPRLTLPGVTGRVAICVAVIAFPASIPVSVCGAFPVPANIHFYFQVLLSADMYRAVAFFS